MIPTPPHGTVLGALLLAGGHDAGSPAGPPAGHGDEVDHREYLDLQALVRRVGDRAASAESKAESAFAEVHGSGGRVGLKEDVAELRESRRSLERELDGLATQVANRHQELLGEMRALRSDIKRTWVERLALLGLASTGSVAALAVIAWVAWAFLTSRGGG